MRKHILALLGAALLLVLATPACSFPAAGGDSQPSSQGEPLEPVGSAVPVELAAEANTDGADTILIPGGTFWMGSEDWDAEAEADEMPRHQVTLGGFRIYTHEVTNAMYARCVEAGGCIEVEALPGGPTAHYADPAFADHPVSGVDWLMARDYCAWANARLPTEAEWELASRSTDNLRYPWGEEDASCERVNMFGCSVPPDTIQVGLLAGGNSAYDGWDMSGNVWEWVHDWYDESAYFFSSVVNPLGPNYGLTKVVRGGGLYSEPVMMRSAARQPADPNRAYDDVGFRCVPAPALALPEGYYPVEEMHERVPPDIEGGGDRVEYYDPDPEVYSRIGAIGFACPEADRILFVFDVTASVPITLSAAVDGVPYACGFDPAFGWVTCEGPVPAAYGAADSVLVTWHLEGERIDESGVSRADLPSPEDCAGELPDILLFPPVLDCPVDGFFTFTFEVSPPIVWDTIRLVTSTDEIDVPCESLSETQTRCIAPDIRTGGHYTFYGHGVTTDGREVELRDWRMRVRSDCPPPERDTRVSIGCYGDHPALQVWYTPASLALESAAMDGSPLPCISTAPGAEICGNLTSAVGSEHTFTLCFEGEDCSDQDLYVSACPIPESEVACSVRPDCNPTVGPVFFVTCNPWPQTLASADVDGAALRTDDTGWVDTNICYGIPFPADPGADATLTYCLTDGPCFSEPVTVPTCEEEVPSGEEWTIAGVGCADETRIFLTVDTGLDWVVDGGLFNSYVYDRPGEFYACSAVPGIPGRLYCAGRRPDSPGALTVRVQQTGSDFPIDQVWEDWPSIVASIPDCSPEAPPPELAPCSSFTSSSTCPIARCDWWPDLINPSLGECRPR